MVKADKNLMWPPESFDTEIMDFPIRLNMSGKPIADLDKSHDAPFRYIATAPIQPAIKLDAT